ncbi:MAG: hypothetical protein ACOC3X_02795 [Nanoarchaeota archaeon]
MYEQILIKDPKEPYEKAKAFGKQEVFLKKLFRQNYILPSLEKTLNNYNNDFEKKYSFQGFIDPKILYGTVCSNRSYDFSKNFYPIKPFNHGDFGCKWLHVYNNIPKWIESGNKILVYEFLHKFYVKEGNKRTSVAKFKNLAAIDAYIIRIIPKKSNDCKILEYNKFLEFENKTGISTIWFSNEDKYNELYKIINSFSNNTNTTNKNKYNNKYNFFEKEIYNPFLKNFRKLKFHDFTYEIGDIFLDYINKIEINNKLNDKKITKTIKSCLK